MTDRRLNKYFKLSKDPKGRLYKIRRKEQRKLGKIVRAKYELPTRYKFTKDEKSNEYEFTKQQYPNQKFEDIEFVIQILEDFTEVAESKIFGSLQAQLVLNGNNLSYSIYASINRVRKNYFEYENELKRKIYEARNIITYCKEYFTDKQEEVLKKFLDKKDIVIDEYNMHLFEQMIKNLDTNVASLYQGVFNNLDVFFDDLLITHIDLELDDQDKILKLLKLSANLIAFYKDQVKTQVDFLKELIKLLQTSPKYEHVKLFNLQDLIKNPQQNLGVNQEKIKIDKIEKEVEEAEQKSENQQTDNQEQDEQNQADQQTQEQRKLEKKSTILIFVQVI